MGPDDTRWGPASGGGRALDTLLRGFEAAAARDRHADLRALLERAAGEDRPCGPDAGHDAGQDDHLYGGLLTVLLRLVFLLYAEDRQLLPTDHELYVKSLSLGQLFEDLRRDQAAYPDTMSRRFGAWPRLLALFRIIHDGAEHGGLSIPRRRGELFDPSRFPFLESWQLPDTAAAALPADLAEVGVPTVDDETVYRVLERLLVLEGQRLSYKVLDVEQIGSVYEALMGYGVVSLVSPAVCCRHKSLQPRSGGGVWIEAGRLLEERPAGRWKFLVETYNVVKGTRRRSPARSRPRPARRRCSTRSSASPCARWRAAAPVSWRCSRARSGGGPARTTRRALCPSRSCGARSSRSCAP